MNYYKDIITRLQNKMQSLDAYNDLELAHMLEDAVYAIETLMKNGEEVVKCKDCRHCTYKNERLNCEIHSEYTTKDYFCASGIRME